MIRKSTMNDRKKRIESLKAALAHHSGDAGWRTVRPPLTELSPEQESALLAALEGAGFAMPGLMLEREPLPP